MPVRPHGGVPATPGRVVQECGAGLVPLLHELGDAGASRLSFAASRVRRSGPLEAEYLRAVCEAFGIAPELVVAHQWVDNGPGWAVLRLPSAADVLALEPDLSRIPDAMVGAIGAYPRGGEHAFEMRTFAPGVDVPEDPVCGSMNASVAQWLVASGEAGGRWRVSQGRRLGRAGTIVLTAGDDGTVWVGGATTTCIRGAVIL